MLRNKQEERFKALKRMSKRIDELDPRGMEWVPVEKPYFMGWDVSITLSESGMRRKDASVLLKVLDILGANKKSFTRHLKFIKWLRRNTYRAIDVRAGIHPYKDHNFSSWFFRPLGDFFIEKNVYENLSGEIKKFFYKSTRAYYWSYALKNAVYRLDVYKFPTYELNYKIEKAYAHYRGIPKGEDRSEYDFLQNKLEDAHFWCAKHFGKRNGHRFEEYHEKRAVRRHMKAYCQRLKQTDFSYEAEEELLKRSDGRFNSKRFL